MTNDIKVVEATGQKVGLAFQLEVDPYAVGVALEAVYSAGTATGFTWAGDANAVVTVQLEGDSAGWAALIDRLNRLGVRYISM